jgi:cytochrome c peroxidase
MAGMTPVRRCAPRPDPRDLGAFKTPSLRNVARTWPYMHNGALHDYGPAERGEVAADDPTPHLMKVVEFYNRGGGTPPVGTLSPLIRPLHLTRAEMSDLVEFLKALTDESVKESELARIPPDLIDVTTDCPP